MKNLSVVNRKMTSLISALALIFLMFLYISISQLLILERKHDAHVINLACRQRILSQKISKDLGNLHNRPDLLVSIKQDAVNWNKIQLGLQFGNDSLGLPPTTNSEILRLFEEIRPHHRLLYEMALRVSSAEEAEASSAIISAAEGAFLSGMDNIVDVLEQESVSGIERLRWAEAVVGLVIIAAMIGIYTFVVNPTLTNLGQNQITLRKSREHLKGVFDHTFQFMALLEPDGTLLEANRTMLDFAGISREQMGPQKFWDTPLWSLYKGQKSRLKESIKKASSGEFVRYDVQVAGKDCTTTIDLSLTPYLYENGDVRFIIAEGRDIQEKKEVETLKSNFVSTTSHQFRTPMAIIQSNAELLAMLMKKSSDDLKPKLEQAIGRIQKEIKRMTNLMDDLLILEKARGEKVVVNKRMTDLSAICHDLSEQFNIIQKDGRKVELGVEGVPYALDIDPKLLGQAISNLLCNAFKYSAWKNPKLQLVYQKGQVKIMVRDYGIGIPQNELSKLFQPFYRAKNVGDIAGTGLGLAIVKEYVELIGGRIHAESNVSEGTTMSIILPASLQQNNIIKENWY